MDISGISSITGYLQGQSAATAETKLKDTISNTDYSQATDDELLSACKQFESYFLEQIFKEMQKTVDCVKSEENKDPNDNLVTYFRDETFQKLAATATESQGLGLAQMLYNQMKLNYNL